ncbi:MAG: hypothetical protein AB7S38_08145 [Vulcanimicrobiota bacterium]
MARLARQTVALALVSLLLTGAHHHREAHHTSGLHLHAGTSESPCALCLLGTGLPPAPQQLSSAPRASVLVVMPTPPRLSLERTPASSRGPPL